MEQNHKAVEVVKKGQAGAGVAIKIESAVYESSKMVGRHFVETDELYSKVTCHGLLCINLDGLFNVTLLIQLLFSLDFTSFYWYIEGII